MSLKELATGFRGRTLKTARLATKVGWKALNKTLRPDAKSGEADEERAVAAATQLLGEMNELKGLVMKFGQMASYLEGSLPPAAQRVLSQLQHASTPMEPQLIWEVVERELGAAPDEVFVAFEREPFAAASIGQVHRASGRDGRQLAVKVQYPGIEGALQSDLRTFAVIGRMATALMPGSGRALIDELRDRMLEECDYQTEARNQQVFAGLLEEIPGASVPAVVPEFCSQRVLTTELVAEHRSFYPFCAEAPQEAKDRAAALIFEVCFQNLFSKCVFNADPHPGNYLFADDGSVAFLDYGCVKRFDAGFIDRWKRYALTIVNGDKEGAKAAFEGTGLLGRKRGFDWDYQWEIMRYLYRPFLQEEPFTYNDEYVRESYNLMMWKNPNKMKLGMPPEWLFLNRLQWGLNSVLARMHASGPWPALWRKALESETEPVEGLDTR